jgi:hypothetical protein
VNERIQELAEQAKKYSIERLDETGELHKYYDVYFEKFAELVISDVLDILADSKNFNKCVYTTFDSSQGQCVVTELAKKIKEHFGNKQ